MAGGDGRVLASIFVNPTQFGPAEDFTKYPRTLEADCRLLEDAGCDAVFVPSAREMYGRSGDSLNAASQMQDATTIDPGPLGRVLEGAIRPGHFRGVCTVVAKLLNITQPSHLLLGQKDFQQQAILRQMCADLNMPVEVITCPTLREADGLAMSSRNRYLNADERSRATIIYKSLACAQNAFMAGERSAQALDALMDKMITTGGLTTQYALICNSRTLQPFRDNSDQTDEPAVLLVAAKIGNTRLIDNMLL
jgi:pantoate--beta-alanine ligase